MTNKELSIWDGEKWVDELEVVYHLSDNNRCMVSIDHYNRENAARWAAFLELDGYIVRRANSRSVLTVWKVEKGLVVQVTVGNFNNPKWTDCAAYRYDSL